MTTYALYREPVVLDRVAHRALRMSPLTDFSVAKGMHASYLAAAEFMPATREMVVVFVRNDTANTTETETEPRPVSPVAMMGLKEGENLFVDGEQWSAHYKPAYLRRYPFRTARLAGADGPTVLIDIGWSGFSETVGEPLFDATGEPTAALKAALAFVEDFEREGARTQAFCTRPTELDLLREMQASVKLAEGEALSLSGFLVVDQDKLQTLPDAAVLELHRTGMLGLIHQHFASLANLQALVDRKDRRMRAVAS